MPQKPAWAFMVPWEINSIGGVNQVVLHLMDQCRRVGRFEPLLLESHYEFPRPAVDTHYGFTRVRVRIPPLLADGKIIGSTLRWISVWRHTTAVLGDLVRQHAIRVVNPHFPGLSSWPWVRVARQVASPPKLILSFHGSDIRNQFQNSRLERFLFRRLLRSATHVVACSQGLLDEVLLFEPTARGPAVVQNGVSSPAAPLPEPALQRCGSAVIVTVGRFNYNKGHDLLLAAFAGVLRSYPTAELWLIGDMGSALEETRRRIAASGLDERVKLLIAIPQVQVAPTIRQADVFVMSSRWVKGRFGEGMPLAILEAGVLGVPVVSTRSCGVEEVIEDGQNGLLTPLEDVEALRAAIVKILDNPPSARAMGASLRDRVLNEFTWERAWSAYEAMA